MTLYDIGNPKPGEGPAVKRRPREGDARYGLKVGVYSPDVYQAPH